MSSKKTFILLFSVLLYSLSIKAQSLTGGITGGISTGSVKITDTDNQFVEVVKGNNIMGYEAGLFAKLSAGPLYVKPKFLLDFYRGTVNVYNADDDAVTSSKININKFELPVLFGFKLITPLYIEAGPVYNYIISATDKYADQDIKIKKSGLGYRAGAGVEFGKLDLNISYQGTWNNSSGSDDVSTFQSPSTIIFGVGIQLGK